VVAIINKTNMNRPNLACSGLAGRLVAVWMSVLPLVLLTDQGTTKVASAQSQEKTLFACVDPDEKLVPQTLLAIIHAPQIQQQLGLTGAELDQLEKTLYPLGQKWWTARNLPVGQLRQIIFSLEQELLQQVTKNFSLNAAQRLQQLELQAQGARLLLRSDVGQSLGLSPQQLQRFRDVFNQTETKIARLMKLKDADPQTEIESQLQEIKQKEIQASSAILSEGQTTALTKLLGPMQDFDQVNRVYPLAPALIDSTEWFGTPIDSAQLKGKVVIVHFYAFQCINCRRNFGRYREWSDRFKDEDVVIVGIQTPETAAELDPGRVREAALRDRFEFPVLIDIEKKNWDAWGNSVWPTVYVIDRNGYLRYWWQGELNWQGATGDQVIVEIVAELLKEE